MVSHCTECHAAHPEVVEVPARRGDRRRLWLGGRTNRKECHTDRQHGSTCEQLNHISPESKQIANARAYARIRLRILYDLPAKTIGLCCTRLWAWAGCS